MNVSRGVLVLAAMAVFGPDARADAIGDAIDRGREFLLAAYQRNPRIGNYPMGRHSLYLAALLQAGMDPDDSFVVARFEDLSRMPLEETYSVSLYLIALDAWWRRLRVHASRPQKRRTTLRLPREIQGEARPRMEELINWLIATRNHGQGTWSYAPRSAGHRRGPYDYSNTQFAVLGLEIGIRNGFKIPVVVLTEIAEHFLGSRVVAGNPCEVSIRYRGRWLDPDSSRVKVYSAVPAGWGYKANERPYFSMTCASLSNILVARDGLRRQDALSGSLASRLNRAIIDGAAWVAQNRGAPRDHRYFYAIYGLEKSGDLGDIEKFGPYDWYKQEAEVLVRTQEDDGSWTGGGYGPLVNTAFALLFLTRATAPRVRTVSPPTIITRAGNVSPDDRDKVYVDGLKGFISARDFFHYIQETRDPDAVQIGREVLRNYTPDDIMDLFPMLLNLWTADRDAVTRFAITALGDISGERFAGRSEAEDWHKLWQEIRKLGGGDRREDDGDPIRRLREILKDVKSVRLKIEVVGALRRLSAVSAVDDLIGELRHRAPEYREHVHRALVLLTGQTLPFRNKESAAVRDRDIRAWEAWWSGERGRVLDASRADALVRALEAARTPEEAQAAAAEVKRIGLAAVPALLQAMHTDEYSIWLVDVLEAISGEHHGFDPRAWERWWQSRR